MTSINATIRSFVAIELPDDVKDVMIAAQEGLREELGTHSSAIRWVKPEAMHLTLQFLGDVPVKVLQLVKDSVAKGCTGVAPFQLETGGLGVFPNARRPRVVWVGLQGEESAMSNLQMLQASIGARLQPLGFKPDKEFRPHLTLGRVRGDSPQDDVAAIGRAVLETTIQRLASPFLLDAVSLMKSDLRPGGSIYTRTGHVALGKHA